MPFRDPIRRIVNVNWHTGPGKFILYVTTYVPGADSYSNRASVYYSSDGKNWSIKLAPGWQDFGIAGIGYIGNGLLFACGFMPTYAWHGSLYYSANGGASWNTINGDEAFVYSVTYQGNNPYTETTGPNSYDIYLGGYGLGRRDIFWDSPVAYRPYGHWNDDHTSFIYTELVEDNVGGDWTVPLGIYNTYVGADIFLSYPGDLTQIYVRFNDDYSIDVMISTDNAVNWHSTLTIANVLSAGILYIKPAT